MVQEEVKRGYSGSLPGLIPETRAELWPSSHG